MIKNIIVIGKFYVGGLCYIVNFGYINYNLVFCCLFV